MKARSLTSPQTAASLRLLLTKQIYICSTQCQQYNFILHLTKHNRPVSKITEMQIILFLRSEIRISSHWSNPQGKATAAFGTINGKWHWHVAPLRICSLLGLFCYLISQVLSRLNFCSTYLDNILIYNTSWKEPLQHWEIIFNYLKAAKLKIKLNKYNF